MVMGNIAITSKKLKKKHIKNSEIIKIYVCLSKIEII
jgi:hypothetical protein